MIAELQSLTVDNFRSIRGEITVPLSAPVVLVHGHNGAGKTSLLTAIELALTGQAQSLRNAEPNYLNHVLHKEADVGRIALRASGVGLQGEMAEVLVNSAGIKTPSLLAAPLQKFFSERCYLAQSTLGRLLEIYQSADSKKSDTPLTAFVKELLGLDRLDALIDGLHDIGHVSRLRNGSQQFAALREKIAAAEQKLTETRAETANAFGRQSMLEAQLRGQLEALGVSAPLGLDLDLVEVALQEMPDESTWRKIAAAKREVSALRTQWARVQTGVSSTERQHLEVLFARLSSDVSEWREDAGRALLEVLEAVNEFFSDLPSTVEQPDAAVQAAVDRVSRELKRCRELVDERLRESTVAAELDAESLRHEARLSAIDQELQDRALNSGALVAALSQLHSHVDGDKCPVCSRIYSEVSQVPLRDALSEKIRDLSVEADALAALTEEKVAIQKRLAAVQREQRAVAARLLPDEQLVLLEVRIARLSRLQDSLSAQRESAGRGAQLLAELSSTERALSLARLRDQEGQAIESAVEELSVRLSDFGVALKLPLDGFFAKIDEVLGESDRRLAIRQDLRSSVLRGLEPPRVWRRLPALRDWEHDERQRGPGARQQAVLAGGPRAGRPAGARAA
ncbi:MAG: AAA family ATPase [Gemmatimonas sp.]|nr:AAA family ATPase [Gemmatimonas sp.]